MAKKIDGYIKLQIAAGQANPSLPIVFVCFVENCFDCLWKN